MKTKTLLIAAATLAVGVISSQAQVYSANIVGYVNQVSTGGQYYLICNPLTTGNDVITNVLQGVPASSQVLTWNGSGYTQYTYSSKKGVWLDSLSHTNNNVPLLTGVAFFYNPGANVTNTFVGSVPGTGSGSTVTNVLTASITPVGSIIPYGDVVTNAATINLTVPASSVMQYWNPGSQSFSTLNYSAKKGVWLDSLSHTNNPFVAVGQGFFISVPGGTNWVQKAP